MKRIKKGELFRNVDGFLKVKGVELKPGSYTDRIQRACGLLTDLINTGQSGLTRAKEETEKQLDKVRQVIHEKTAPRNTPPPAAAPKARRPAKAAPAKTERKSKSTAAQKQA
jgi:hypothetical protein